MEAIDLISRPSTDTGIKHPTSTVTQVSSHFSVLPTISLLPSPHRRHPSSQRHVHKGTLSNGQLPCPYIDECEVVSSLKEVLREGKAAEGDAMALDDREETKGHELKKNTSRMPKATRVDP